MSLNRNEYPPTTFRTTAAVARECFKRKAIRGTITEVSLLIHGSRAGTYGVAAFRRTMKVANNAGTLALETLTPQPDTNAPGWTLAVTTSGEYLVVNVTGGAYNVDWEVSELPQL